MHRNTYKKIVECAGEIFTEKGFKNTTIAEICNKADVNVASVNYYFGSKEKLYVIVIDCLFEEMKERFPFDEKLNKKDSEKFLRNAIKTLVARNLTKDTKGNFYKIVTKELAEPTGLVNVFDRYLIPQSKLFEKIISNFINNKNEEMISVFYFSIVSQCVFPHFSEKGVKYYLHNKKKKKIRDIKKAANYIADFCIGGIKNVLKNDKERKKENDI